MENAKIEALIAELEAEIEVRRQAIRSLRNLIPVSNIEVRVASQMVQSDSLRPILFKVSESYVSLAAKIIAANDFRPLPMSEIVAQIRILRDDPGVERRSVEATLYRHMKMKGDQSRIIKVSPGIYGVRKSRDESVA
jgi:hypothetical protein